MEQSVTNCNGSKKCITCQGTICPQVAIKCMTCDKEMYRQQANCITCKNDAYRNGYKKGYDDRIKDVERMNSIYKYRNCEKETLSNCLMDKDLVEKYTKVVEGKATVAEKLDFYQILVQNNIFPASDVPQF